MRTVIADEPAGDAIGVARVGMDDAPPEATPKMFVGKLQPGQAVTLYYVQADTGVIAKVVSHDVQGRPMITTTRTQIKIGAAKPAERFKPPPGAEINDMTK